MIISSKVNSWIYTPLILGIIFFSVNVNAQIKGKVQETLTKEPIPFVHITLDNHDSDFLTDNDGNFEIPFDSTVHSVTFQTYLHRTITISIDSIISDTSLIINMDKVEVFEFDSETSGISKDLIEKVMIHKKENETTHLKFLSYTTYNKATLTPEKVENTNRSLRKISKFFSLKFHAFKQNQHFLIIESVTNKNIYNKNHQKEVIEGAKSTIVNVPSVFVQTTQIQAFSPYDDFINIAGKIYVSPLAQNTLRRYAFSIIDTITTSSDTIYVAKYNPFPKKNFDALKGLLYINTKNYAVQFYTTGPAKEKGLIMSGSQSFKYYPENKTWFPDRTKTSALIEKSGEHFLAILNTYITKVNLNSFQNRKQFDEVVLEYPPYANDRNEKFWNEKRAIPLLLPDSNTYIYYDSIDQKKYIQRTLQFGEHLYYGVINYRAVDIELRRITDGNNHEGFRVGFGGHTNHNFSERFILGGYYGYGFKDQEGKFGADVAYHLRRKPVIFRTSFMDDVIESGGVNLPYTRYQYSSEPLRRVGVYIMDRVVEWENSADVHPAKYLDMRFAFSINQSTPTYDYQFKNLTDNHFQFREFKVSARYAYGEQFIQLLNRRVTLGSNFPILYFQYTKGFNNFLNGEFNYHKFDLKTEYSIKVLDLGKSGIQIVTGLVKGDVPYVKLYNGNGSFKPKSVVIHNSFETMRYNEFLSDKYISFFMSHDFGRLYFRSQNIRPSLLLVHNIGFGWLRNPQDHQKIPFKTMEKGYIESGMLLDNILVFRIAGLRIGLGTGFFYRYGAYANERQADNFVLKLTTNFTL